MKQQKLKLKNKKTEKSFAPIYASLRENVGIYSRIFARYTRFRRWNFKSKQMPGPVICVEFYIMMKKEEEKQPAQFQIANNYVI